MLVLTVSGRVPAVTAEAGHSRQPKWLVDIDPMVYSTVCLHMGAGIGCCDCTQSEVCKKFEVVNAM